MQAIQDELAVDRHQHDRANKDRQLSPGLDVEKKKGAKNDSDTLIINFKI